MLKHLYNNPNPIFKGYKKSFLKWDIIGGLTIGIMVIPQGMAYSVLANLPPVHGLYACIIPVLIYAFLGTSKHLVVGPTAMEAILTAVAVGAVLESNPDAFFASVALITIMTGIVQFLIGVFKLGFLINFISNPVLSGFTSAVAIIIICNQMKYLFGLELVSAQSILVWTIDFCTKIKELHLITAGFSGIALLILVLGKKYGGKFPTALFLMIASIIITRTLQLDDKGVQVIGTIPSGFPSFVMPKFELSLIFEVLQYSIAIALISIVTSTANSKVVQSYAGDYEIDPNQEIRALGLSNIGGAFFSSFPVSGSFSRTFVNYEIGSKTQVANLVQLVVVLLTLLFFTSYFYHLPNAILGSIIVISVYKLVNIQKAKTLFKQNKIDFLMLLLTFLTTLFFGISAGIITGIVLSIIVVLYLSSNPHIAILEKIQGTNFFRNITRYEDQESSGDILIIRFDHHLYYLNANYFKNYLFEKINEKGEPIHHIIIHSGGIAGVDSTGIDMLFELHKQLKVQNIQLYFTNVVGPVRDVFHKVGFFKEIGEVYFFMNVLSAYESIKKDNITRDENAIQRNPK